MIIYNYRKKTNQHKIANSQVSFWTLMQSSTVISFIALTTNSRVSALARKIYRLRYVLRRMIKSNGLECVCKRIKAAEKSYLLGQTASWFSLRHVSGEGITPSATKVLLSIHRNMISKPKLDVSSLYHKSGSVKKFLIRHKKDIKKVLKHPLFNLKPFGKTLVKSNRYWKTVLSLKRYNPFTVDPTVDSNDRTGGFEAPLQISLKSRSNGSCLDSQSGDSCALSKYPRLLKSIHYLLKEWKYGKVHFYEPCEGPCKHVPSKLFLVQDKSCKTRVIAIFDTYSQVSLKPVHKMIQDNLNLYGRDFTMGHLKGINYLRRGGSHRYFYSIDLSKATDSIPCDLSFYLLRKLASNCVREPKKFVSHVRTVMTCRPFHYEKSTYRYMTGQPMGSYGSFPLLAITNHFLALLAYSSLGELNNMHYAIVGDDIVISSKCGSKSQIVGDKYISLCEELGIPINTLKCVYGQNSFEFCRRFVVDGKIRSFPSWNSHYQSILTSDPYIVLSLLRDYECKIPSYFKLINLKSKITKKFVFPKSKVKNLLFVTDLELSDAPKVFKIPMNVLFHAERSLQILDSISSEKRKVVTSDKFLKRLNYNNIIRSVFKSKLKKSKDLWLTAQKVRANTFYLSYISTYLDRFRLKKKRFLTEFDHGRSQKLIHFSTSRKYLWHTLN